MSIDELLFFVFHFGYVNLLTTLKMLRIHAKLKAFAKIMFPHPSLGDGWGPLLE